MKEKWINDIHDKMADYQMAVPDGLLDNVKRELDSRGLAPSMPATAKRHYTRHVSLWQKAAAAIAVIALVSMAAWLAFREGTTEESLIAGKEFMDKPRQVSRESSSDIPTSPQPKAIEWVPTRNSSVDSHPLVTQARIAETSQAVITSQEETLTQESPAIGTERENESKALPRAPRTKTDTRKRTPERKQNIYVPHPRRDKGILAFSGYVSGGLGNTTSDRQTAFFAVSSSSGGTIYNDNTLMLYSEKNSELLSAAESYSHTDHHEPIKVGVSLRVPISHKWSVTTGLTYSYLTSDFIKGNGETATETTQKLHYVGIPINANYTVYRTNRLHLYATAGGEVAKLVSGKKDIENQVNQASIQSRSESVKEGRPQFSANLSVGAEYRLVEQLSLYAEPGASYYFDNGSDVENIYKEKSLNLSVQVGLRWELK